MRCHPAAIGPGVSKGRAGAPGETTSMQITDVRVYPVDGAEPRLKAYVTITIDHCFVIRDLKVIDGATGLFVAMPSKRRKDGTFRDIAHPLNAETRQALEKAVLDEYARELARGTPAAPDPQG